MAGSWLLEHRLEEKGKVIGKSTFYYARIN